MYSAGLAGNNESDCQIAHRGGLARQMERDAALPRLY